jgi:hypothetical protein
VGGGVQAVHEVLEHDHREVGIEAAQVVGGGDRLGQLDRRAAQPVLVLVLDPRAPDPRADEDRHDRQADLRVVEAQPEELVDQLEQHRGVARAAAAAAAATAVAAAAGVAVAAAGAGPGQGGRRAQDERDERDGAAPVHERGLRARS